MVIPSRCKSWWRYQTNWNSANPAAVFLPALARASAAVVTLPSRHTSGTTPSPSPAWRLAQLLKLRHKEAHLENLVAKACAQPMGCAMYLNCRLLTSSACLHAFQMLHQGAFFDVQQGGDAERERERCPEQKMSQNSRGRSSRKRHVTREMRWETQRKRY